MKEKLEVGMYAITKDRMHIGNINDFRENCMKYALDFKHMHDLVFMSKEDFEASYDLKDFIKVGDILEIEVEKDTWEWEKGKWICWIYDSGILYETLNSLCEYVKVVSIVTKEEFDYMKYEVRK